MLLPHVKGLIAIAALHLALAGETRPAPAPARAPEPSRSFRALEGTVTSVSWSPDGTRLATAGGDGAVRIWSVRTLKATRTLEAIEPSAPENRRFVWTVRWSPDGRKLAAGSEDGFVRVWNPSNGGLIQKIRFGELSAYCLEWSKDGRFLACNGSGDGAVVWETSDWKAVKSIDGSSTSVGWGQGGRLFSLASAYGEVHFWSTTGWKLEKRVNSLDELIPKGARDIAGTECPSAWSPDGRQFAVPLIQHDRDGFRIQVWDTDTFTKPVELPVDRWTTYALDWSAGGKYLAATNSGDCWIWSIPDGKLQFRIPKLGGDGAHSVAWSPHGEDLAVGFLGGDVRLWSLAKLLRGNRAPN